jgi:predicted nucleic acid-binding protein
MILVDTSVWVSIFRDKAGEFASAFRDRIGPEACVLSRFSQLELLQGAKDEKEWLALDDYLSTQLYLEATGATWCSAARIFFDLRREGITINSPIDCCIAQLAIENGVLLLHRDHDFERINKVRHFREEFFQ